MKATYYKDTLHSYMVIPCPPEAETEGYQYRMLEMNRIVGILPCGLRYIDGEKFLYYNVTGKQSIRTLYEDRKIPGTELFRLLKDMDRVSGLLAGFLLDEQHLILSPDQIFYDFGSGSYSFTYYPGAITEPEIFRFLAEGIEGSDKRAAAAAYRLCAAADSDRKALMEAVREEAAQKDKPVPWEIEAESAYSAEREDRYYNGAGEKYVIKREDEERAFDRTEEKRRTGKSREERSRKEGSREESGMESDSREELSSRKKQTVLRILLILILLGGAGGLISVTFLLYITQREKRLCIAGAILLFVAAGLLTGEMAAQRYRKRKARREEDRIKNPVYKVSDEKDLPLFRAGSASSKEDYQLSGDAGHTVRFSEQETIGRLYGRDRGNRIDLRTLPVTIGKSQAYADILLGDPSISRVHARIYKGEEGGIEIRDLDSTNGTWINGVRLGPNEKVRVQRGDEVRFGNVEYEYR